MRKVKGIYEKKTIKLLEDIEAEEGTEVEVVFSEKRSTHLEASKKLHKRVKESIVEEIPQLAHMSSQELKKDFENLSKKVASSMKFDNWKDAERFMRGMENYDARRH